MLENKCDALLVNEFTFLVQINKFVDNKNRATMTKNRK